MRWERGLGMTVRDLPLAALAVLRLLALLMEFSMLHAAIRARMMRAAAPGMALCCALLAASHFMAQMLFVGGGSARMLGAPAWSVMLALAAVAAGTLAAENWLFRWGRRHLSPMSVKTAADALPTGLCCYNEEGLIRMMNETMAALSTDLTGRIPSDGAAFWREICARFPRQDGQVVPVVRLNNGEVYQFLHRQIVAGREALTEISAANVTALYLANEKLQENNLRLEEINRRMQDYSREMAEVVRDREILAARMVMHDEVGQILLTTRYCVEHPEAMDAGSVLTMWEHLAALLLRDAEADEDVESGLYGNLIDVAKSIGVRVEIDGELPRSEPAYTLIARGLHTCITNVRKHADGDRLSLRVRREASWTEAVFTNDGKPPQADIQETGGLGALRQLVEQAGGRMTVTSRPAFSLTLRVPGR